MGRPTKQVHDATVYVVTRDRAGQGLQGRQGEGERECL